MATAEFSDVVLRIVEQYVEEHVYTSIPCKVLSVDNFQSDQTIDIQPQIINTFKDSRNIELPPILDVPVIFPSAGGGILSFPISVGDTVLAVFSMKSIEDWMDSREEDRVFTPSDKRTYSINDAIAIAGLYSRQTNLNPNPTDVELKFKGSSVKIQEDGVIVLENSSGSVTIESDSVELSNGSETVTLTSSGDFEHSSGAKITSDGDFVDFNGTTFSTHTHSGGGSGPPVPGS